MKKALLVVLLIALVSVVWAQTAGYVNVQSFLTRQRAPSGAAVASNHVFATGDYFNISASSGVPGQAAWSAAYTTSGTTNPDSGQENVVFQRFTDVVNDNFDGCSGKYWGFRMINGGSVYYPLFFVNSFS